MCWNRQQNRHSSFWVERPQNDDTREKQVNNKDFTYKQNNIYGLALCLKEVDEDNIYDLNAFFFFLNALSGMLLLTGAFEFDGIATLQQTVFYIFQT